MTELEHIFEDFGRTGKWEKNLKSVEDFEMEEEKLAAFEKGYTAGWEDAERAQKQISENLTDSVKNALVSIQASYVDVKQEHTKAMKSVFETIVTKLMPHFSKQALPYHIADLFEETSERFLDKEIEINVSEIDVDEVSRYLRQKMAVEHKVMVDKSLAAGQAYVRLSEKEYDIDLMRLTDGVLGELDQHLSLNATEMKNE